MILLPPSANFPIAEEGQPADATATPPRGWLSVTCPRLCVSQEDFRCHRIVVSERLHWTPTNSKMNCTSLQFTLRREKVQPRDDRSILKNYRRLGFVISRSEFTIFGWIKLAKRLVGLRCVAVVAKWSSERSFITWYSLATLSELFKN